jgi:hypothetical protein
MEWYIRFKNSYKTSQSSIKWLKAHKYQIRYVENYIKYGIHPDSTSEIKLKFIDFIKKDDAIYATYLNEYGELVEMLYDSPDKVAYINRITDIVY